MKVFVCLFALSLVAFSYGKPFKLDWSLVKAVSIKTPFSAPNITNCTKPDDEGAIISVTFDPTEPKKGDSVDIKATFKLKEDVTSGTIKVSAKFDGVSLYNGDFDLCEIAEMVELTCPLKEGMHSIEVSVTVPDIAPNGSYSGEGTITDQDDKEVACGRASYKLE